MCFAWTVLVVVFLLPGAYSLSRDEFPSHFVFGASTSAYQVEGAANKDGRKPSIWDTFSHAGNGIACFIQTHFFTIKKDFTAYVDVCFKEFGDRVKYWTTVNEGNVYAMFGYDIGILPPQRCSPSFIANCSKGNSSTEPYLAAHHMLLAHASAARLYRTKYKSMQHGFIGFNILAFGYVPITNTSGDVIAAQRARDFMMGWFLNPLTFGDYPDIMKRNVGSRLPSFTKKESNLVKGSIDFLGINFYYSFYVKNKPDKQHIEDRDYRADMEVETIDLIPNDTSIYEVPITTWILQDVLDSVKNDYGDFPIYIHENGQKTFSNSSLDDWSRVKYLHEYIGSMANALRSGSNVKGYFVWSLLDSFEILGGYEISYGLYYVDMKDPNLKRQPKLSAEWYANFLKGKPMDPKVMIKIEKNPLLPSHTFFLHNAK
ncbi:hypothetical protein RYX36_029743 [Vicia faba]